MYVQYILAKGKQGAATDISSPYFLVVQSRDLGWTNGVVYNGDGVENAVKYNTGVEDA